MFVCVITAIVATVFAKVLKNKNAGTSELLDIFFINDFYITSHIYEMSEVTDLA